MTIGFAGSRLFTTIRSRASAAPRHALMQPETFPKAYIVLSCALHRKQHKWTPVAPDFSQLAPFVGCVLPSLGGLASLGAGPETPPSAGHEWRLSCANSHSHNLARPGPQLRGTSGACCRLLFLGPRTGLGLIVVVLAYLRPAIYSPWHGHIRSLVTSVWCIASRHISAASIWLAPLYRALHPIGRRALAAVQVILLAPFF
jgi:hypothetical protein